MNTRSIDIEASAPTFVRLEVRAFLGLLVQLLGVAALLHLYGIEADRGLLEITPWILGGFAVHAWLPPGLRRGFFVLLSWAVILTLFPWGQGFGMILVGLGLIGLCHLPVPWSLRIVLLLGCGALLSALRAGAIGGEWAAGLQHPLSILGGMFMFRMVLYVYDERTEKGTRTLGERLGYFFLLPNVLTALFPIVDYKTFRRTYYDAPAARIYQKGVNWMVRGVVHLLLYRLIYLNFTPAAAQVHDLASLVLYMVSAYALYLRVSGLFHLIIGVLCLFGYNLPETHHHYFLASGFNDLWRRINIYWKDFMMKVVYYPVFLRLRRRDATLAMVVSTLTVFLVSWWLHSYQWFWVQGTFPLTPVDAIFWSIFAVCVLVNSMLQAKGGSGRSLGARRLTPRAALVGASKVVAMFTFMCCLWSFWTAGTIDAWNALLAASSAGPSVQYLWLGGGLVAAVLLGAGATLVLQDPRLHLDPRREAGISLAWTALLLALAWPGVDRSGESRLLASIRHGGLSDSDEGELLRGYYEEVLEGELGLAAAEGADDHAPVPAPRGQGGVRGLDVLRTVQAEKPDHWKRLEDTPAKVLSSIPLIGVELAPSFEMEFCETMLRTNRWGMRDRDYPQAKPPGVHRIAFLGASVVMGSGVENHEVFDELVEERLNRENARERHEHYEVLNFAVNGYTALQQIGVLEHKVRGFDVDTLMLFGHPIEERLLGSMVKRLGDGKVPEAYPELARLVSHVEAGNDSDLSPAEWEWAWQKDLLSWSFRRLVSDCESAGIRAVWVYLQHPQQLTPTTAARGREIIELARGSGFLVLELDGRAIYPPRRAKELRLRPWDNHPNAEGHRRIADELMRKLHSRQDELDLDLASTAGTPVR